MKRTNIILLLASITTLAACDRNTGVNTVINSDGTCSQEIFFKADTATLINGKLHRLSKQADILALDSSWALTWSYKWSDEQHPLPISKEEYRNIKEAIKESGYDSTPCDTLLVHAKRSFDNVEEMCAASPFIIGKNQLETTGRLTTKFRWFYTDYTYTQTYSNLGRLFPWPTEYHFDSKKEARYYLTGQPNSIMQGYTPEEKDRKLDELTKQGERWITGNLLCRMCDAINYHSNTLAEPNLTPEIYRQLREKAVRHALDSGVTLGTNIDKNDEIIKSFSLGENGSLFFDDKYDYKEKFEEEITDEYGSALSLNIDYNLRMPGKIIDCGNGVNKDGYASYLVTGGNLVQDNYTITATSRVVNIWAFVVTIIAAIAASIAFTYRKR